MAKNDLKYPSHNVVSFWEAVLPSLLAKITRVGRHRVDNMEWSDKSIMFNIFRLWELVFWRRNGKNGIGDTIRAEASTVMLYDPETGKHFVSHKFFTWEATSMFAEYLVVEFFKKIINFKFKDVFSFEFVEMPVFATSNGINMDMFGGIRLPKISFAIAFVQGDSGSANGPTGSFSYSHTTSGTNRIFCQYADLEGTGATITGQAYNSVATTAIYGDTTYAAARKWALGYLVAPTTGTNNASSTLSTSTSARYGGCCSTYSGANQTGQPDSFNDNLTNTSTTSKTIGVTTVANNCWLVGGWFHSGTLTGSGGTTIRTTEPSPFDDGISFSDSNAALTPAGSHSIGFTMSPTGELAGMVAAFSPNTSTAWTQECDETITDTDTIFKSTIRILSQSITDTDTFNGSRLRFSTLTETISDIDTLVRMAGKVFSETLHDTDTLIRTLGRALLETITDTDTIASQKIRPFSFSEAITNIDTLFRTMKRTLSEAITDTDTFSNMRSRFKTLTETITDTDVVAFARNLFATFTETLSYFDQVIVMINGIVTNLWSKVARTYDDWTKTPKI